MEISVEMLKVYVKYCEGSMIKEGFSCAECRHHSECKPIKEVIK